MPSKEVKTIKRWQEKFIQEKASEDDARLWTTPQTTPVRKVTSILSGTFDVDNAFFTPNTEASSSVESQPYSSEREEKKHEESENKLRETICREDVHTIFSAIAVFENSVMLVSHPFVGNELAAIALDAVKQERQSTVQSIGLFHTGEDDVLECRLTVLKNRRHRVRQKKSSQNKRATKE